MFAYNQMDRLVNRPYGKGALFGVLLAVPFLASCSEQPVVREAEAAVNPGQTGFFGSPVEVGNGAARTYILTRDDGVIEVGIALSEDALEGLPTGAPHGEGAHDHFSVSHVLEMPAGNPTPFQFVGLDWNPSGHIPPGIYDLPHFDMHFYTVSKAERDAIVPSDPQYAEKAGHFPIPSQIPAGYADLATLGQTTPEAAAVPLMGMHWVDVASPELNGSTFTETLIYGSWDGEVIFVEPMITRAFLQTRPDYSRDLPVADLEFSPASYRIYWNDASREYRIALEF